MKTIVTILSAAAVLSAAALAMQGLRPREEAALAEPFRGVTTDGSVVPGLYAIRSTGVSTEPVREAAEAFLAALTGPQRDATTFAADDVEWRRWHNVHRAPRKGVSFGEMTPAQRERAFALFAASLSADGLTKTKNVMRLNEHLGELVGKPEEYGDEYYHVTVMGEPHATEPWGWQLDGHHLVINYFVLGDQVVMSPSFMGSEPVIGSGDYAGVSVMQEEQDKGLALMDSLDEAQKRKARLDEEKTRGNALAQAFNDNLVLDYAGIPARELSASQRDLLRDVVREYVHNQSEGHARLRMEEIEAHLEETYFAWIGDTGPDAAFYYRIQSPVVLIEFDHQGPIALPGPRVPSRRHVHSVVRTPNGNDYGKDLLRQHYERHSDDPAHGHQH